MGGFARGGAAGGAARGIGGRRRGARRGGRGRPATHRVSACWRCAQLARAPDGERGGGAGAPASFIRSSTFPSDARHADGDAAPVVDAALASLPALDVRATPSRRAGGSGGLASAGRAGNCRLEATSTSSPADDAGAAPLASSASSKEKRSSASDRYSVTSSTTASISSASASASSSSSSESESTTLHERERERRAGAVGSGSQKRASGEYSARGGRSPFIQRGHGR